MQGAVCLQQLSKEYGSAKAHQPAWHVVCMPQLTSRDSFLHTAFASTKLKTLILLTHARFVQWCSAPAAAHGVKGWGASINCFVLHQHAGPAEQQRGIHAVMHAVLCMATSCSSATASGVLSSPAFQAEGRAACASMQARVCSTGVIMLAVNTRIIHGLPHLLPCCRSK